MVTLLALSLDIGRSCDSIAFFESDAGGFPCFLSDRHLRFQASIIPSRTVRQTFSTRGSD